MFLGLSFIIPYAKIGHLSIYTHIFYIAHDLGALGVAHRYKSWIPYN